MDGSRLTGLASLALALGAGAMPAAANELGVAVIVGNREYADERVPAVSYAHNDAEAFKRFVTGRLGFDEANVIDLRDATKSQLETAFGVKGNAEGLVWRYIDPSGGSDVMVFYSGHGVPGKAGRGYLLPVDSNPDTAELNGYPIDLLYENLGGLPAQSTMVFLDACFSGGSPRGMLIRSASPVYVEGDVSGVDGLTVLTAASGAQLASWDEGARHGLFTEHLLDGLYGAADADGDGRVTAREAKLHLDRTMTYAARRMFGREQDAGLYGDESAVLSFSPADGWGARSVLGPPLATFTVVVEPAEARVRILNDGPPYRAGMELAAGSYEVEASASGYVTQTEMVSHGASPTMHRLALRKAGLKAGDRFRDCAECPEMVVVPAGRFRMGDLAGAGDPTEKPVRRVQVRRFALARHETTVGQFLRFATAAGYRTEAERDGAKGCRTVIRPVPRRRSSMLRPIPIDLSSTRNNWEWPVRGNVCDIYGVCSPTYRGKWDWTPGRSWQSLEYAVEEDQPVACVSWNDARAYIRWLNDETGGGWRLPSEAEWEYAARAGSETLYHFGDDASRLCDYGNVADSTKLPSGGSWTNKAECADGAAYPTRVGSYLPNAWGLHDMHGNLWEWVEDCWYGSYGGAPKDGSASESGDCSQRVFRGGSWDDRPSVLRAANRVRGTTGDRGDYLGFRVARTLAPES